MSILGDEIRKKKQQAGEVTSLPFGTGAKENEGDTRGTSILREAIRAKRAGKTVEEVTGPVQRVQRKPVQFTAATAEQTADRVDARSGLAGTEEERLGELRKEKDWLKSRMQSLDSPQGIAPTDRTYQVRAIQGDTEESRKREEIGRRLAEVEAEIDRLAPEKADWGKIGKGVVLQGADQVAKQATSTAAMLEGMVLKPLGGLLGNEELYKEGLLHAINEKQDEIVEGNQERFQPEYDKGGKLGQAVGKYGAATVAALPQAALAFVTAGQSLAFQQSTAGLQAASSAASATGAAKIAQTVTSLLKNTTTDPGFLYSLVSTMGGEYEQAKADGADDAHAYAYAALTGYLNSLVEVGGGIDQLPDGSKKAVRQWVETMLDEGKEEVIQGAISQLAQNAVYGKGNALASATDEDAVLSAKRAVEEFVGGAVVGGILGGGQIATVSALNKLAGNTRTDTRTDIQADTDSRERQLAAIRAAVEAQTGRGDTQTTETANADQTAPEGAKAGADIGGLLERAAGEAAENGRVTNRTAVEILSDSDAVTTLAQEAGLDIREGMSKSQRREAVKSAVDTLVRAQRLAEALEGYPTLQQVRRGESADANAAALEALDAAGKGVISREEAKELVRRAARQQTAGTNTQTETALENQAETLTDTWAQTTRTEEQTLENAWEQTNQPETAAQATASAEENITSAEGKAPGFYGTAAASDAQYLDRLAKAAGVSMEQVSGWEAGRQQGWIIGGRVYLSEQTEDPLRAVAKHEITHRMQELAADSYGEYRSYVEGLKRRDGTLETAIQARQELYRQNGQELTYEQALDEVAADFAGELLDNEALITRLAGERPKLGARIRAAIGDLLRRLKTALSGQEVRQLEKAARLWDRALQETNRAYQQNGQQTESGEARYSVRETALTEEAGRDRMEETTRREDDHYGDKEGRAVSSDPRSDAGASAKNGGGPGVQKGNRGDHEGIREGIRTDTDAAEGRQLIEKAAEDYHVPVEFVKEENWPAGQEAHVAYSSVGKIYVREGTDPAVAAEIIPHEATHVMKQTGFQPYLDLVEKTPELMDWTNKDAQRLLSAAAAHRGVDLFSMSGTDMTTIYDEINAIVSGGIMSGQDAQIRERLENAFYDYDLYREEVEKIHREFRGRGESQSAGETGAQTAKKSVKGTKALEKQIQALERQNRRLKEQLKRTDTAKVSRQAVEQQAGEIRKAYQSGIDRTALADRLGSLYEKMGQLGSRLEDGGTIVTEEDVRTEARGIAEDILTESRANVNPKAEEYEDLRKELRSRRLYLAPVYRADLEQAGGYNEFRRRNMGSLTLSTKGTAVDVAYQELSDRYPNLFPDDIVHPADQLVQIGEVAQGLKRVLANPYEQEMEHTAQYLAGELMERFYETPDAKPTLADKMEQQYQKKRLADRKANQQRLEKQQAEHQQREAEYEQKLMETEARHNSELDRVWMKQLADQKANQQQIKKQQAEYQRQIEADRKANQQRLEKQQAEHQQRLEEMENSYREANRKRIENQTTSQRRETIRRGAERLGRKLANPTDTRHIPESFRGATLAFVKYLDLGSNYEMVYDTDGKYHRVEVGSELGAKPTRRTLAARELQQAYADLEEQGLAVDPDMLGKDGILDKIAKMGEKRVADMNRSELDTVWTAMQVLEKAIGNENKRLKKSRYRAVSDLAEALRRDNGQKEDRGSYDGLKGKVDDLLNLDMAEPLTFFSRMGEAGEDIYIQMRDAKDRQTEIIREGTDRARQLVEDSGVNFKKADRELHTFQLADGQLTLSTSQLMELYALSKRQQAQEHIYLGGLKPRGAVDETGKITENSRAVHVTPAEVAEMLDTLTAEQKQLMDGLQSYLSGDLAGHGNRESLAVYGYEKFKEKNYWPIKVSSNETQSDAASQAKAKTIPGYGMTKTTRPHAKNAVELRSALDSFCIHLNQMSTYAAWLDTNENLTRLENYQFQDKNGSADGTMKGLLEKVYGKGGQDYYEKLLQDIAQGTKVGADPSLTGKLMSNWKAAKVGANLRVVIQQPTAILRAMSMVDPKYFTVVKDPMKGWAEATERCPIAQWKDWGYFETGTGKSLRELVVGSESVLDWTRNASGAWAGKADALAWGHLWNAVKAEVTAENPDLTVKSKAWWQTVSDRFGDVVDRTQVVDSVLHRSQIMRSSDGATKKLTAFQSEPTKIYNMALRDLNAVEAADGKAAKQAAAKAVCRDMAALVISFTVNAAAQSFMDAVRDDDRDKAFGEKFLDNYLGRSDKDAGRWEKIMNVLGGNFASNFNLLAYIPVVKEVWSVVEGYTLGSSDLEGLEDAVLGMKAVIDKAQGKGQETWLYTGLDAACKAADLLGLPASNLRRDAGAIFRTTLQMAGAGNLLYEWDKLKYDPETAMGIYQNDLYRAMDSDWDLYEKIYDEIQEEQVRQLRKAAEAEGEQPTDEELEAQAAQKTRTAMENRMKKELGITSAENLPYRYSAPGENEAFDSYLKERIKSQSDWIDLPEEVEDLVRELEDQDPEKTTRVLMIANSGMKEDWAESFLHNTLSSSEWERYEYCRDAGVTMQEWADAYNAIGGAHYQRTGKRGSATKADTETALGNMKGLTDKKRTAIWNSYVETGVWKSESPWG